jgi:hypothetical protein
LTLRHQFRITRDRPLIPPPKRIGFVETPRGGFFDATPYRALSLGSSLLLPSLLQRLAKPC